MPGGEGEMLEGDSGEAVPEPRAHEARVEGRRRQCSAGAQGAKGDPERPRRRSRSIARFLAWESLKIILLVAVFLSIQSQILEMRGRVLVHKDAWALAEARQQRRLEEAERRMEGSFQDCAAELSQTKLELTESLARLDEERGGLRGLLEKQTRQLEGALLSKLDVERGELALARSTVEAQKATVEKLSSALARDPKIMKEKMVFPTVQLKGNGTVGSGVVIYSQEQSGLPDGISTSFVLTAYHVVVEVLGDRLDRGIIEEVHALLEDESDTLQTFAGKLVLFDRARDVALLRLNTTRKFKYLAEFLPSEEFQKIDVFARAYAVGCPLGNKPLPTLGEISSKTKVVGDQTFWMLSAPTFFGNSGGGIYLAESCRLIGVSSMIYTYGKTHPAVVPHMGLFVPVHVICRWLDSEGYSFLYERKAIPRELLWKLAYVESPTPVPRNAASSPGQEESPGE